MPFAELDRPALARALAQLAEGPDDLVDAFLERVEVVELPGAGEPAGRAAAPRGGARGAPLPRRSELARQPRPARRRGLRRRRCARWRACYPRPRAAAAAVAGRPWGGLPASAELRGLPAPARPRAARSVTSPSRYRLTLRRHRRELQVAAPHLAAGGRERDLLQLPRRARLGTPRRAARRARRRARRRLSPAGLADAFRAREAPPPASATDDAWCSAPAAAAMLLHEAVAHALEADTLAPRPGAPEAARGVRAVGRRARRARRPRRRAAPGAAAERRRGDAGAAALAAARRRRRAAARRPALGAAARRPAAGRRAARQPPSAAGAALELPAAAARARAAEELVGAGRQRPLPRRAAAAAASTRIAATSRLAFAHGRRIRGGALHEPVGPCRSRGRVADLLARSAPWAARRCRRAPAGAPRGARGCRSGATAPELLLAGRGPGSR